MSYSNPLLQGHYQYTHDFGAGAGTFRVQGPKGRTGLVKYLAVDVDETFTNVTLPAFIRVGTAADADAYAEMNMGVAAINTTYDSSRDDTDAIINPVIPPDTEVLIAFTAPTGGTPAGIGDVSVFIDWS